MRSAWQHCALVNISRSIHHTSPHRIRWDHIDCCIVFGRYGAAKAKRKELCAAAGFADSDAYRQVEVKFCVDVPTIAIPPSR